MKKTPDPWRAAYWEGEIRAFHDTTPYTTNQKDAICKTIPKADLRTDAVLGDVYNTLLSALGHVEYISTKPLDRTMLQQLTPLETQVKKVIKNLDGLHAPTEQLLNRVAFHDGQSAREVREQMLTFLRMIQLAKNQRKLHKAAKGGRPKNLRIRSLVWQLVYWWDARIGTPDCTRNDSAHEGYTGAFYEFAVAAITPLAGDRGLDAAIERIVHDWQTGKRQTKEQ